MWYLPMFSWYLPIFIALLTSPDRVVFRGLATRTVAAQSPVRKGRSIRFLQSIRYVGLESFDQITRILVVIRFLDKSAFLII